MERPERHEHDPTNEAADHLVHHYEVRHGTLVETWSLSGPWIPVSEGRHQTVLAQRGRIAFVDRHGNLDDERVWDGDLVVAAGRDLLTLDDEGVVARTSRKGRVRWSVAAETGVMRNLVLTPDGMVVVDITAAGELPAPTRYDEFVSSTARGTEIGSPKRTSEPPQILRAFDATSGEPRCLPQATWR